MSRNPLIAACICFLVLIGIVFPGDSSALPPKLTSQGLLSKIAESQGTVLVVNFWATWCPSCQEELEILKEIRNYYPENNVKVLGVSIDDTPQIIEDYLQNQELNYQVFFAAEDIIHNFNIKGIPKTYIFNHNGQVVFKEFGLVSQDRLQEIIDNILKKQ